MTRRHAPRTAVRLLERFLPGNDALIGDLLEEFERRQAPAWFWAQTLVAVGLSLASRERAYEIRPLRLVDMAPVDAIERSRRTLMTFPPINMAASPLPCAGGLTIAGLMLWLTYEAPEAWWALLASTAAGLLLSVCLIERRRPGATGVVRSILFASAAIAIVAMHGGNLAAQRQEFSVASIKPASADSGRGGRGGALQPGRFAQSGVTLRQLIQMAYGTDQIAGGPEWMAADRFDVDARGDFTLAGFLPGAGGSPPEVYMMLQRLLETRFRLGTHREMQPRPVFALTIARADRQLGPRMRVSPTDCDALLAATVQSGRPPSPPAAGSAGPPCSISTRPGVLHGDSISAGRLATVLAAPSGRPIVDRTGLDGVFNVDLEWTPVLSTSGVPDSDAAAADAPVSIFTAVQEQLGLELDPATAPIDVLVVDHADRPTAD
jgi:uncharacterized protein (TIGR03435 family)